MSRSAATSPGTSCAAGYDAVIVATGMVIDRKLGVPGEDLPFVWGSWKFVAWLNGHPDFRQGPDLSAVRKVAVIGNGNVALDVARVLAKTADEMAKSDIVPEAGAAIAAAPLTDIYVIGRRGPEQASFTNNELAEMGRLARAVAVTDPAALDGRAAGERSDARAAAQGQEPRDPARLCQEQAGQQADHGPFPLQPADRRRSSRGEFDLVDHLHRLRRASTFPKGEGVFAVGWAKRGPSGTIPTNRADSHAVAQQVIAWLKERDPKSGPDPMPLSVDVAGWHRIDKAEVAAGASQGRPRVKLTDWQALLDTRSERLTAAEGPCVCRRARESHAQDASFRLYAGRRAGLRGAGECRRPCSRCRCIPISRSSIRSGPRR